MIPFEFFVAWFVFTLIYIVIIVIYQMAHRICTSWEAYNALSRYMSYDRATRIYEMGRSFRSLAWYDKAAIYFFVGWTVGVIVRFLIP